MFILGNYFGLSQATILHYIRQLSYTIETVLRYPRQLSLTFLDYLRQLSNVYLRKLFWTILGNYLTLYQATILYYRNCLTLSQATIFDYLRQLSLTILGNYQRLSQATILNYLTQLFQTILGNYLTLSQASILDYIIQLSNTFLDYSAGKKKRPAIKGYFWVQKIDLFVILFFSCLKMLICEMMLLELDDFLGSFLLRNFFSAARSIFSCKILALLFSISGGSETNSKQGWVVWRVGGMEELRIKLSQLSTKLKLKLRLSLAKL